MPENIILNERYRLEELQGAGGMAVVYRAWDMTLERSVAIKLLRKDLTQKPEFRQQFHQEAKAAANLSHPNIVTVHDFGLYADQLYIVMEFVPGIDLKSLVKQHGRLSVEESLALLIQACAGVGYAHRAGLVHCDIKPQNLLVTPEKRLKVLDFGIARALSTIAPGERSEVVWGSPQYFAPEQAAGAAPSPASDVYSLGVVLFELLTGQLPFSAPTTQELARLHRESLPPSPRKINLAIPVALERIVLKALSKEPSARYQNADQLGKVLMELSPSEPIGVDIPAYPAQPASAPAPKPSPVKPAVAHPHISGASPASSPIAAENIRPAQVKIFSSPPEAIAPEPSMVVIRPPREAEKFDWITWILAIFALIAAGGLIPFWLWVLFRINSPV